MTKKMSYLAAGARKGLTGAFALEDLHLYRVDRNTFSIYVGGDPIHAYAVNECGIQEPGVEYLMADRFEISLNMLSSISSSRPILVHLSSCGGDWEEGMKMFGAILACPNPVTVLASKWARSMTSIIPLAADRFVIRPPARYMFHRGDFSFGGLDQEADTADIERRIANEMMLRIYTIRLKERGLFHTKKEEEIRAMLCEKMRRSIDCWLSCDEAKRWGFVDDVYTGDIAKLRAVKINKRRREQMWGAIRSKVTVRVIVK